MNEEPQQPMGARPLVTLAALEPKLARTLERLDRLADAIERGEAQIVVRGPCGLRITVRPEVSARRQLGDAAP
jgi:hypothetical protein